jgi:hypothetical protein
MMLPFMAHGYAPSAGGIGLVVARGCAPWVSFCFVVAQGVRSGLHYVCHRSARVCALGFVISLIVATLIYGFALWISPGLSLHPVRQ